MEREFKIGDYVELVEDRNMPKRYRLKAGMRGAIIEISTILFSGSLFRVQYENFDNKEKVYLCSSRFRFIENEPMCMI